jgi:hypothetical protein
VENVRIQNLVMENVGRAISVSQYYTMQGESPPPPEPVSVRTPVFRNISISGVTIRGARGSFEYGWNPISISGNKPGLPITISISGLPEMPIEALRLSDIVATGTGGLRASDTDGLELSDVRMDAARGPAFVIRDSRRLRLEGISTGAAAAGIPILRLDRCPGARVGVEPNFGDDPGFISVGPGEKDQLRPGPAQVPIREESAGLLPESGEHSP